MLWGVNQAERLPCSKQTATNLIGQRYVCATWMDDFLAPSAWDCQDWKLWSLFSASLSIHLRITKMAILEQTVQSTKMYVTPPSPIRTHTPDTPSPPAPPPQAILRPPSNKFTIEFETTIDWLADSQRCWRSCFSSKTKLDLLVTPKIAAPPSFQVWPKNCLNMKPWWLRPCTKIWLSLCLHSNAFQ